MGCPTVRRKFKRRSARPITLQTLMRACAWPIGEDTEIRLWLRVLRALPTGMLCLSVTLLVCWKTVLPLRLHAASIVNDVVTLFWWNAFCEDADRLTQAVSRGAVGPNDTRSCQSLEWLLPAVAVLLTIPYALFK